MEYTLGAVVGPDIGSSNGISYGIGDGKLGISTLGESLGT